MSDSNMPESRSYRHVKCDGVTTVSDQSFEVLSNPMSSVTRTWCSATDSEDYEESEGGSSCIYVWAIGVLVYFGFSCFW